MKRVFREGTRRSSRTKRRAAPRCARTSAILAPALIDTRAQKLFSSPSSLSLHGKTRALPALHRRRAAARVRDDLQRHLLIGAQLQSTRHGRCGYWPRRAATAAADCDEDIWFGIDISPHSEVTACRCKLCAKAASEHRIMACRRVPCYDLKLEQSEGTVWLSVGEVR